MIGGGRLFGWPFPPVTAPTPDDGGGEDPVGTVLYVDPATGSDGNLGTSVAPLRTLNRAGQLISSWALADRADARVYLRGKLTEYNYKDDPNPAGRDTNFPYNPSSWTFDGVAGQPVKIMTDPASPTKAVLDGSSVPMNYSNRTRPASPQLLWIYGDNIEVDGVDVQLSAGGGVAWGETFRTGINTPSHNGAIRNADVRFCHGDGVFVSGDDTVAGGRGTGFVAENSAFHHCQDIFNGGNSASGLKIVAHQGAKVINCEAYKNSDDGFDNYASRGNDLGSSRAWSNGYFSSETNANWSKYGRADLSIAPQGNGNGFKMAGGSVDTLRGGMDNIAHHCISFWNSTIGFTHNGLRNGLIYNCIGWENVGHGFNFRDGTTLVGNVAFGNNLSAAEVYFDNANGDWPPNQYNSWGDGMALGNPLSQNNFDINTLADEFLSLDPSSPDFMVPKAGGILDSASGGVSVPVSFAISHPDGVTLSEADFAGLTPTLGVKAVGTSSAPLEWNLEGDEAFDRNALTSEQQLWFDRSTHTLPGSYPGATSLTDEIKTQPVGTDNGSGSLIYTLGRKAGEGIGAMAWGLRATGYLGFLDGICEILNAMQTRLEGPLDTGKYSFRYFPDKEVIATLDELLTHGWLALAAYACHVNRSKLSPGDGESGLVHNYGAIADFWITYLDEDFPHKWWSGDADGSGWDFSMNGGTFGSAGTAADGQYPFIWRHYQHVAWVSVHYYLGMYEMTGKAIYLEWRDKWVANLMQYPQEHSDGFYAYTWGMTIGNEAGDPVYGGSDTTYLVPSTYINYIQGAQAHCWAEGLIADTEMFKLTGFMWAWMPLNGYQSMQNDPNQMFGNSMGGGDGNGDVTKAGISNSDVRAIRDQRFIGDRNSFMAATLFHPEALQLAKWIYQNLNGSSMTPEELFLSISILGGTIKQGQ